MVKRHLLLFPINLTAYVYDSLLSHATYRLSPKVKVQLILTSSASIAVQGRGERLEEGYLGERVREERGEKAKEAFNLFNLG